MQQTCEHRLHGYVLEQYFPAATTGYIVTKCTKCGEVVMRRELELLPPRMSEAQGGCGTCTFVVSYTVCSHTVAGNMPWHVCSVCGFVKGAAMEACGAKRPSGRPVPVKEPTKGAKKQRKAREKRVSERPAQASERPAPTQECTLNEFFDA